MHVREWGSPDGRPLVFWHALGGCGCWRPMRRASAGHDLFADAGPELARLVAGWARRLPAR